MEIKEGMYVRTKYGIKKIYKINHNAFKWKYLYELKHQDGDGCIDLGELCDSEIIGEPSYNILDLIQVGDYANGLPVIFNAVERGGNIILVPGGDCFTEDKIKSIVTKEQFESMKYIVERK